MLYYAGHNKVCRKSITKFLIEISLRSRTAVKKPLLNKCQLAARMAWAQRSIHWNYARWRKVALAHI